jgi:hypothetical protein
MPLQSQSPTSSTSQKTLKTHSKLRQNEATPPLSILDGLKVNKRRLILDEEGDPIGELCEGDIVDCVRKKADANGAVLDEHGRVVGRVRTLLRTSEEPMLRWKASNVEKLHGFPLPPISATSLASKSLRSDDARSSTLDRPAQTQKSGTTQNGGPPSLSRAKSNVKRREAAEQDDQLMAVLRDLSQVSDASLQGQDHEQISGQQELGAPRLRPHARSDSLASVPESHSTSEIELSDDGSFSSVESQQESVNDGILSGKRVRASFNARTEPPRRYPMSSHARSVSEPMHLTTALPPVPPRGKSRIFPTNVTTTSAHVQRNGLSTTPSRVQSLPPPAFPYRGLAGGLPGNIPFAGCPVPGTSARPLTTPALPTSSTLGTASLTTQLPALRPRLSGTIPLVRSPLSSQGTN